MHAPCKRTLAYVRPLASSVLVKNFRYGRQRFIQTFRVPTARQQRFPVPPEDAAPMHVPVMEREVVDMLAAHLQTNSSQSPSTPLKILDFTFGAGGHSTAILHAFPRVHAYAVDRDPVAVDIARRLSEDPAHVCYQRLTPMQCKFSEVGAALTNCGESAQDGLFDAVLLDAGCSSMQFDDAKRGFSVSKDAPLDMRMGGKCESDTLTAADVVNGADEQTLARIFKTFGEERMSKKIARHIVEYRATARGIKSTTELANVVAAVKCGFGFGGEEHELRGPSHKDLGGRFQHPATLTFQALRIFVNDELNELDFALHYAYHALKRNGIAIVLTFHSLEDAIVKDHFTGADQLDNIYYAQEVKPDPEAEAAGNGRPLASSTDDGATEKRKRSSSKLVNLSYRSGTKALSSTEMLTFASKRWAKINKQVLLPMFDELEQNPRARSAKLRAAIKA